MLLLIAISRYLTIIVSFLADNWKLYTDRPQIIIGERISSSVLNQLATKFHLNDINESTENFQTLTCKKVQEEETRTYTNNSVRDYMRNVYNFQYTLLLLPVVFPCLLFSHVLKYLSFLISLHAELYFLKILFIL